MSGGWSTGVSGELYIGRRIQISGGELYFDGLIDELEIFNRMLSQAEIAGIHAAGADGNCKDNVPVELMSFSVGP